MKIVIFMENNQNGGLDTFCATLINMWPDENDLFTFICNANHPGLGSIRKLIHRPCEIVGHQIPLSWVLSQRLFGWLPSGLRRASQPFLRILLYPIQLRAIRRLFVTFNGDALLVINGGFPGGETCRIANIAWHLMSVADGSGERRVRNVHSFHNFAVPPRRGFAWFENAVDRVFARSVGTLLSVSRACASSLSVRQTFAHNDSVAHIYNGIDDAFVFGGAIPNLRRVLNIGDAPLCLILANYEPRKGHRFLFEAFAKVNKAIPGAHLVACGGGTEEEMANAKMLCEVLAPGANIHLLDFVPGGTALIEQVDVVLISSQAFESFGLTAIEAMVRGVPVVATSVGGLPEVLGEAEQGGYLVSADDSEAYAARVIQLLSEPLLRREMGRRGQERVAELFTARQMADKYFRAMHAISLSSAYSGNEPLRSEWHFLKRRLAEPGVARDVLKMAWLAVLRRSGNRLLRGRRRYYPQPILSLADAVSLSLQKVPIEEPVELPPGPKRLRLAVGHLTFDDWPLWKSPFDDHEQYVSLHRWNWLLRAVTDETDSPNFAWGVALMRSWLKAMSPLPIGDASESYTVGERIVNACLFARHTRGEWDGLPEDLVSALGEMAVYLATHLEYHHGELSGNHVLNNGRALLFFGHYVSNESLVTLGRALLKERLPVLVEEGGFLREGSSHYQFLFTRWLLELRLLAEEKRDQKTLELLRPVLPSLVEACRFFVVEGADGESLLPTIGDISPDCEPAWLLDLPKSPLALFDQTVCAESRPLRGWASLFPGVVLDSLECCTRLTLPPSPWRAFPKAGWYRLDEFGWVAIWRAESSSGVAIASHAHHDSGSVVLFHKGQEVLIDPGRRDYTDSLMGKYGFGGEAHNGALVDDRPTMLSRGDRMLPECYREANCAVNFYAEEQAVKVSIDQDGLVRLAVGVTGHRREFVFNRQEVVIRDFFQGSGLHRVEARFHMPLNCGVVELALEKAPADFQERKLSASQAPIGGWRFPAYGIEVPAETHIFRGSFRFPAAFCYRLKVKEV